MPKICQVYYIYGHAYFVYLSNPVRGGHHGKVSIFGQDNAVISLISKPGYLRNFRNVILAEKETPAARSVTWKRLVFTHIGSFGMSKFLGCLFPGKKAPAARPVT